SALCVWPLPQQHDSPSHLAPHLHWCWAVAWPPTDDTACAVKARVELNTTTSAVARSARPRLSPELAQLRSFTGMDQQKCKMAKPHLWVVGIYRLVTAATSQGARFFSFRSRYGSSVYRSAEALLCLMYQGARPKRRRLER